jgi:hypothetical protein
MWADREKMQILTTKWKFIHREIYGPSLTYADAVTCFQTVTCMKMAINDEQNLSDCVIVINCP